MSQYSTIAEDLGKFCDQHRLPELVAVFQTPDDRTITIHIARDGKPSVSYEALKEVIDCVMNDTDKMTKSRLG